MTNHKEYQCPRCGYLTCRKCNMRDHLYKKTKPCAAIKEVLELTAEIKEHVLANKIYVVPEPIKPQIIINQQLNNFISKMCPFEKLNAYIENRHIKILPLETQIEENFGVEIGKCESIATQLSSFSLNTRKIMEIVNRLTTSKNVDTMNIMYDKHPNKLSIYDGDGEWEEFVFENGVKELIEKIQFSYLDYYEELLLEKISEDPNFIERQRAKELLEEYYVFLVSFEVKPYLINGTMEKIKSYNDKYYKLYEKIKNTVRLTQAKDIKRSVYNIVKNNCNSSITELNKKMMDLICTDEHFKTKVLERQF